MDRLATLPRSLDRPLPPAGTAGYARPLAVLEMGEETTHGLGVRVARVQLVLLATAVLLVSFAAAAAGPVAFVALTAPQLARRLTGAPGPNLLPSLCVGAGLVMAADWRRSAPFPVINSP